MTGGRTSSVIPWISPRKRPCNATATTFDVDDRGSLGRSVQAALFFGVFLNPLLVVALQERIGGTRAAAVAVIGMVLMVLAGVALVVAVLGRQRGVATTVVGVAPSR